MLQHHVQHHYINTHTRKKKHKIKKKEVFKKYKVNEGNYKKYIQNQETLLAFVCCCFLDNFLFSRVSFQFSSCSAFFSPLNLSAHAQN
jgi:hypothetical protein